MSRPEDHQTPSEERFRVKSGEHVVAPPGEQIVQHLVQLAQRDLSGENPFARLRPQRDGRRRAFGRTTAAWALALIAVCAGCWLAAVKLPARGGPITYRLIQAAPGPLKDPVGTSRLRFSEGSEVVLEPGADTVVSELSANGAKLAVKRGGARFAIRHRSKTAWLVQAGPYSVRVTGTEFDVRWSEKEGTFELAMLSGSVEVSGGDLDAPVRLVAGQSMLRRSGKATNDRERSSPREPAPAAREDDTVPQESSGSASVSGASPRGSGAAPGGQVTPRGGAWAQLVAQGKSSEVIRAAEQQGIDSVLATSSLSELSALADAARYVRSVQLAERALLTQRQRFKGTTAARNAAFLLGQLAESRGTAAQAWFDTYLQEAPNGSYASQAWGRKMMILYQQRGAERASAIATEYLARYPDGPYATAARKIISEASSGH